jgi:two-component system sensor histidine kinase ChvG
VTAGFPGIVETMNGKSVSRAWSTKNGGVILTASTPVQNLKQVLGAVYITQDGTSIKKALHDVTVNILAIFILTIVVTVVLSLYLSGGIARPLRRLAKSADEVQQGKVVPEKIPDFSRRRDEIGDLSIAFRDMTTALADRIDSIERFAADVAHEIKNPLTSLRSAVETASIVSTDKDRKRLFEIIQHDVQRLDRLISDISNASRLDAELARETLGQIDLIKLLDFIKDNAEHVVNKNTKLGLKSNIGITLSISSDSTEALVLGIESRLGQVFTNLVDNALSFSPEDGLVEINAHKKDDLWIIEVCDQGPGIPENKLDSVFERFYSERPDGERFGQHSGLGLSISKQIIEAHRGQIYAENIFNEAHQKTGAKFTVILKAL